MAVFAGNQQRWESCKNTVFSLPTCNFIHVCYYSGVRKLKVPPKNNGLWIHKAGSNPELSNLVWVAWCCLLKQSAVCAYWDKKHNIYLDVNSHHYVMVLHIDVAQQWRIHLQCRRCWRPGFDPWVGRIPRRRKWQPTPAFLPENPMERGPGGLQGCRVGFNWAHTTYIDTHVLHVN